MTLTTWLNTFESRGSGVAIEYKAQGKWLQISWSDYLNKIISASHFLADKGMQKKSHVGLMSSTRWEWAALDLAILASGSVTVPMYPNLSDDDLLYTINHSEIEVLIYENEDHQKQLARISSGLKKNIVQLSIAEISFSEAISSDQRSAFLKNASFISPQDMATIVYTSGTTGQPKGAVLLHEAIYSEVVESFDLFGIKKNNKCLTFLPFAHVLGRIEHWGSCYVGHSIAYAESIEKIKGNLLEVKPDFLIAVPRIFEKVYSGIMAQIETNSVKQKLFTNALEIAEKVHTYRKTKQIIPWSLLIQYEFLNQIAFSAIKKAFGGRLQFAVSGGAPLSPQLAHFFACCGISILEGYGLTETCAAITVNNLVNNQPGTVGQPIGDVQIKFAEDGEILVKSKKCLKEYYKNPEATQQSIINGYFATGDIGIMTESGFLKITDRKKDLIKTAGGKYVAPQKLEGLMKQEPLISQVLIFGDQKKFISALISLDEAQIKQWAKNQNITFSLVDDLYHNPALKIRIQKHIQSINTQLASYEAIKKFEIVPDNWTVENGSLTQSLKVKRKFLEKKYHDLIEEMYS